MFDKFSQFYHHNKIPTQMEIRITFIDIHCISFHTLSRQQFEKLFSTKANYPKVALAKL